jgi:long-chain fatty acid transport protein
MSIACLLHRAVIALTVSSAIVSTTRDASADPLPTYGFGSRETSLAGAVTADTSSFAANFYNPAGLVFAHGLDLSFGYFRVDQTLKVNGGDNNVDPVKGIVGGVVAPGNILGLPFAFGIATHLPDDRLSRVRTKRQDIPRWELYDNRAQILYIATNLAIRPVKWLAIGGGIAFLSSTRGTFGISGTASVPDVYKSQLRHTVDADLTTVRIPLFGVRFEPSPRWSLGAVYRGESKLDLQLTADIKGNVYAFDALTVPVTYSLSSKSFDAFMPRQVAVGGRFDVNDRIRLLAEVTWTQWSSYQSATSRSSAILNVDISPGILYVPPNPKPTTIRDPAFKDRLVPRLGAEVKAIQTRSFELPVRVGYFYERSPVPPQTGYTNFIDADRHAFSAGVGMRLIKPATILPGDVRLDLHAVYILLPETQIHKQIAADYIGDFAANGHQVNYGATLGVGF